MAWKTAALLITLLPLAAFASASSESRLDEETADCGGGATTLETGNCLGEKLEAAEADLKSVYGKILASIAAEESAAAGQKDAELELDSLKEKRQALQKAQKAWKAFRDADCEAQAFESIGGTVHGLEVAA